MSAFLISACREVKLHSYSGGKLYTVTGFSYFCSTSTISQSLFYKSNLHPVLVKKKFKKKQITLKGFIFRFTIKSSLFYSKFVQLKLDDYSSSG